MVMAACCRRLAYLSRKWASLQFCKFAILQTSKPAVTSQEPIEEAIDGAIDGAIDRSLLRPAMRGIASSGCLDPPPFAHTWRCRKLSRTTGSSPLGPLEGPLARRTQLDDRRLRLAACEEARSSTPEYANSLAPVANSSALCILIQVASCAIEVNDKEAP